MGSAKNWDLAELLLSNLTKSLITTGSGKRLKRISTNTDLDAFSSKAEDLYTVLTTTRQNKVEIAITYANYLKARSKRLYNMFVTLLNLDQNRRHVLELIAQQDLTVINLIKETCATLEGSLDSLGIKGQNKESIKSLFTQANDWICVPDKLRLKDKWKFMPFEILMLELLTNAVKNLSGDYQLEIAYSSTKECYT